MKLTMKHSIFGRMKSVYLKNALFALVITKVRLMPQITSGKWVTPALVVHVLKFFMIMVIIFGVEDQVHLKKMAIVLLRSGISSSCSTTVKLTAPWTNCQSLQWIRVWDLSVLLPFCKVFIPITKLIFSKSLLLQQPK